MSDSTIKWTRPRVRTFEQMNAQSHASARLSPALVAQLKTVAPPLFEDPWTVKRFRRGEMPETPEDTREVLDWCYAATLPDHYAAVVQARGETSVDLKWRKQWPDFVARLRDCPSVESLAIRAVSLDDVTVRDGVLVDFVQGHPQLTCLRLHDGDISAATMNALLDVIAVHPGLEHLELDSGPAATDWLPRLGSALERNDRLQVLALRLDPDADPDDQWVLGLQYANICRSIAASPALPLRRLELTSLDLADADVRAGDVIADMLDAHRNLQALVLHGAHGLTRRSWDILGSMTELESLDVSHMSDGAPYVNSADALARLLLDSRSLQSIDASHACLEPGNVDRFANAIARTRIPRLHLKSCEMPEDVQNAVLAALPSNTTLTHFALYKSRQAEIERTLARNRDMASDGYRRWVTGAVASALREQHLPADILGEIAGHVMGDDEPKDYVDAMHLGAVGQGVRTNADACRTEGSCERPTKKARHI